MNRTGGRDGRARLGAAGEEVAARHLARSGYRILQRGYRTRLGEIDIVAARDGILVFVEVKARSGTGFGTPAEAVGPRKRARMARAAAAWLAGAAARSAGQRAGGEPVCRFDVIGITWAPDGRPEIDHILDAFRV